SRDLIAVLTAAFRRAGDDAAARCVIFTGAGPVFCAGMDLAELQASLERSEQAAATSSMWDDALRLAELYQLIYGLPKPTIAAVACRAGLINATVSADQLLDAAHRWARALAEGGPEALARTKGLLQQMSRQALSVEETARASAAPRLTPECQHGLGAFFAKRP